jgi:hypothetical protein
MHLMPETPGTIFVTFQDAEKEKEKQQQNHFQAKLIRRDGSVRVANRPQWVHYLPLAGGQPGKAYNAYGRVLEQEDVQVIIGYPPNSTTPCVISLDPDFMQDNTMRSPLFASHGQDHRYMGIDHAPVDPRSIQDLMVLPGGSLDIKVLSGRYNWYSEERYFAGTTSYSLSTHQPATVGKRGVGVYLDRANTLQSVAGSIVAEAPGTQLSEPLWPSDVFQVCLVVVYASKDFVDKEDIKNRRVIFGYPEKRNVGARLYAYKNLS